MSISTSGLMPQPSTSFLLDLMAVRLRGADGNPIAMATLISPSVALTDSHLVADHQGYFVELGTLPGIFPGEHVFAASIIARDERVGFAALELEKGLEASFPWPPLSSYSPEKGSSWESSLSFDPSGRAFGTIEGIELVDIPAAQPSTFRKRRLFRLLTPDPNFEMPDDGVGAPVMVENQLIGLTASVQRQNGTRTISYAIPLSEILESKQWPLVTRAMTSHDLSIRSRRDDDPVHSEVESEALPQRPTDAKVEHGAKKRLRARKFNAAAFLERLSSPSSTALAHAEGIRAKQRINILRLEHLLAGLFHEKDGPTQREFQRAGIPHDEFAKIVLEQVGTQLPEDGAYTPILSNGLSRLSRDVREALIAAMEFADTTDSWQIGSRHLIRGALSVECSLIQALLGRGVIPENILLDDEPLQAAPRRPTQAGIRSDDPEGEDLLDIKAEVEALCTVLASRDVKPPISLGLFGEWGSGKSFFMKKMEARFNQLKEVGRQGDSTYCANIVQLWFNAWHYMDTNLWASLATEIFDKLAEELARQDALAAGKDPEYERAQLVARRTNATEEVNRAAQAKREADAQVRMSEQQLASIQSGEPTVAMSPQDVLREGYRFAIQQPEVRKTVVAAEDELKQKIQEAARTLNMERKPETLKEQLLELQGFWGYVQAIVLAVRNTKDKRRLVLLLTTFVVVTGGIFWLLPRLLALSWIQSTWVRIAGIVLALVGGVAPYLPAVHRALKIVRDAIKTNQESIEKARLEAERKLQTEHESRQLTAKQADETLKKAVTEAQRLTAELDELRADRKMSSFIRQRQESSDYTRYLGVIARARNDFQQLSVLIAKEQERSLQEQHAQRQKKKGEQPIGNDVAETEEPQLLLPRIDRIILYIDDLDRCPEDKVVDVLQAVHLLLAFPLFVVVVGVDPRWLLHSLRQHSKAFQDTTEGDDSAGEERVQWQSTPLNYLEKIFQIPFTLWPMGESGFGKMVDTLTEPPKSGNKTEPPDEAADTRTERPQSLVPAVETPPVDTSLQGDMEIIRRGTLVVEPVAAAPVQLSLGQRLRESLRKIWPFKLRQVSEPPLASDQSATQTPREVESTVSETNADAEEGHTNTSTEKPAGDQSPTQKDTENIDPNPEHLQITEWERTFMKQLHQLIPSPRATKRFVNVYRLIRASVDVDERLDLDEFIGNETQGKYRAVLTLLAILTGYPDQATEILRDLLERKHKETWWEFIDSFKQHAEKQTSLASKEDAVAGARANKGRARVSRTSRTADVKTQANSSQPNEGSNHDDEKNGAGLFSDADAERWQQLMESLEPLRGEIALAESCDDFVEWAPKVARYSFQSGRVLFTRNAYKSQTNAS